MDCFGLAPLAKTAAIETMAIETMAIETVAIVCSYHFFSSLIRKVKPVKKTVFIALSLAIGL